MNAADEINFLTEKLVAVWGRVVIEYDGHSCLVADKNAYDRNLSAASSVGASNTLAALRLAAKEVEEDAR